MQFVKSMMKKEVEENKRALGWTPDDPRIPRWVLKLRYDQQETLVPVSLYDETSVKGFCQNVGRTLKSICSSDAAGQEEEFKNANLSNYFESLEFATNQQIMRD